MNPFAGYFRHLKPVFPLVGVIIGLIILCSMVMTSCSTTPTTVSDENFSSSLVPVSFSEIVEKAMPSVVYVFVEVETGIPGQFIPASGSGVILRNDGYILTNRHVVENARRAEVTLQDRSVYEVSNIWLDDIMDLAVIKIDAEDLPVARFGDPENIRVGDWVIALGHPLGLSPIEGGATVTVGVVSNLGRSFTLEGVPYYDIIQTDAAINPGNSGGPLMNLASEVIGINSAGSGEAQNINFAINIATAKRVFDDIMQYGRVIRPYLGAVLDDINPAIACEYCLTKRVGAIVVRAEPRGPADIAGLQENDIIVMFGDEEVVSAAQLVKELWKHEVGESVSVIFWRGETEMETTAVLTERPGEE
jgi:serine protease Do